MFIFCSFISHVIGDSHPNLAYCNVLHNRHVQQAGNDTNQAISVPFYQMPQHSTVAETTIEYHIRYLNSKNNTSNGRNIESVSDNVYYVN
jgi:hypothetical protein